MSALGDGSATARTGAERERAIATMVQRDRMIAIGFVVLLWVMIGYVLVTMQDVIGTSGVPVVLAIAGLVLIVLVTAGVTSLIRHNSAERERIYGPDLDYADFNRAAKRAARS